MSAYSDSRNRDRERERVMIALQVRQFLANGGRIQQLPAGVSAAPHTMTHREQGEASWRVRNGG